MRAGIRAFAAFLLIAVVATAPGGGVGPAAADDPPSVAGAWRSVLAGSSMKLILEQDGTTLSGYFESGSGDLTWDAEGTISAGGSVALVRFIPIAELSGTPEPARTEVLSRHGDPDRLGYLRGPVRLQFDAESGELTGAYSVVAVSYDTESGALRNAEVQYVETTLARATDLPDFRIESFAIAREESASGDYWEVTADILNAGGDAPDRFDLRLEKIDRWSEGEPSYRAVAGGGTSHPALAAGESTMITWRTDMPTATANQANVVAHVDLAIRLVVDPDNEVVESSEVNNEAVRWRLSCAEPVVETTPLTEVVWVEFPEGAAGPGAAPESYDMLLEAMEDKAEAVLCRIKLEALRRATMDVGTVAGSKFVNALMTHFLKEYFAAPGRATGLEAIDVLGEYQGFPGAGLGAYMYVPRGLRQRYPDHPGDWTWIYPATQFWITNIGTTRFRGKFVSLIRHLDIPFLVGSKNLGTGVDADVVGGGKNMSNVMHWATGVKYWSLPKDALRELFIGYEFWHLEGWDVFGEDAINDLIAEEAGRMLGVRLASGDLRLRSEHDLVRALDQDFREARAWVGAMLRLKREKFDELILAASVPQSTMWFGWEGRRARVFAPWPRGGSAKSIRTMLDDGSTVAEVSRSGLVEQLTQIYTLIYAADEWERRHGAVGLTDVTTRVVEGDYDDQFKSADKAFGAEWQWSP